MKILLKEFQAYYADELMTEFRAAVGEAGRKSQAIALSAPTGSGKTVMATAFIERVLFGDDDEPGDADYTFLWVTDQPELNEQTRDKMVSTSSFLASSELVVVDAGFDQEQFESGKVYFLNTQKLSRNSTLVREGNDRTYTLWESITNTVEAKPTKFVLIIDEAHRGMQERNEREDANSIIQRFIKGFDSLPPIPIVVGISATIERFNQLIAGGSNRNIRQVDVPAEQVRTSGLLKEIIDLYHPDEDQPSDTTMLREAIASWKKYRDEWKAYSKQQEEPYLEPILLIQVQDGSGSRLSNTNLGEVVRIVTEEVTMATTSWFGHAFQDGAAITVDGRTIRNVAPSKIEGDAEIRFVLFKTSLNTGWDCPRAEVIASFRSAKDATLIAQLVGRMVRAPLARRVDDNEFLNTVSLYLPSYDRAGLANVIKKLVDDPASTPPAEVREGALSVELVKAPDTAQFFELLQKAPSYTIPRAKTAKPVVRLSKLASLLAETELDVDAPQTVKRQLVDKLLESYDKARDTPEFLAIVAETGQLAIRQVSYGHDPEALQETAIKVKISQENVEDLYKEAGRLLGEGLHTQYWRTRVEQGGTDHRQSKLEVYALAANTNTVKEIDAFASSLTGKLTNEYKAAFLGMEESVRQRFRGIQELASEPVLEILTFPSKIEGTKAATTWEKHLYCDEIGLYYEDFAKSSWEPMVVRAFLEDSNVVSWLRNEDRKPYSIRVPYKKGGSWAGAYPDFLIFRRIGSGIIVDIADPHLLNDKDAPSRAVGMAEYAEKHGDFFGKIELILVEGSEICRVDLVDESWRHKVATVKSHDHLKQIFEDAQRK